MILLTDISIDLDSSVYKPIQKSKMFFLSIPAVLKTFYPLKDSWSEIRDLKNRNITASTIESSTHVFWQST